MKNTGSFVRPFLASALMACLLPLAHAQWSWKDSDGRRVFSDQPPPVGVPDKDILRRPALVRAASELTLTETPTSTTVSATVTAPKISGKDPALEKKIKEEKAKEVANKKAEEDKVSAAKKENCERAKRAKASFDSGIRVATTNAKGEREIMSDLARASEAKRLQDIINSDCG